MSRQKRPPVRRVVEWHFAALRRHQGAPVPTTTRLQEGRERVVRIEAARVPRAMPWERRQHTDPVAVLSCGHPRRSRETAAAFPCRECARFERELAALTEDAAARGAAVYLQIDPEGGASLAWRWPGGRPHGLYFLRAGHPDAPTDWTPWTAAQGLDRAARALAETEPEPACRGLA